VTQTASDKAGRSLPAPGRGIIGSAAQSRTTFDPPLMNMAYRKRNLQIRRSQIQETKESQLTYLEEELNTLDSEDNSFNTAEYRKHRIHEIDVDAQRQGREALNLYSNNFWRHDTRIAPIRGALAVWGLTIDDLDVSSFHGTSTKANERNECEVINEQLTYLGRRKGNVIPGVFQKYLTGHPKGAAGAWMLNGCLQMLDTGLIPGNRNADNIEEYLRKFEFIAFPNKNIQTDGIKAFSVTSFGFGQKGAQVIGVHPKYLFATLAEETFRTYQEKVLVRQKRAFRKFHEGMANNSLFIAKEKAPYAACEEMEYLLNPEARLSAGV
jgi:fatty acid synthase subunit alpha